MADRKPKDKRHGSCQKAGFQKPAALEKRIDALEKAVKDLTDLVKELKERLEKQPK